MAAQALAARMGRQALALGALVLAAGLVLFRPDAGGRRVVGAAGRQRNRRRDHRHRFYGAGPDVVHGFEACIPYVVASPPRWPCSFNCCHADGNVGSVDEVRLTASVEGRVQGVGFRYCTRAQARALGLSGSATNLPDGRVEVVAEGPRPACEALLEWLRGPDAPGYVRAVTPEWSHPDGPAGFTVR